MPSYSELSAIELQREIDNAVYYSEDNGPELANALKEIERLREVCQEIIETIATERAFIEGTGDLQKLSDIAERYYPMT